MDDAIVIGGGFYGTAIAAYLSQRRGLSRVVLLEREEALLQRASYRNQARVHNGYHYPRSFTTAFRSRVNLPLFVRDYSKTVKKDFSKVYAIARSQSKVTARQFSRFCQQIGAKLELASPALKGLFDRRLIEEVFLVEEHAFDSSQLAAQVAEELAAAQVQVRLSTRVRALYRDGTHLRVELESGEVLHTRYVFNCTYSGLNQLGGEFAGTTTGLKHEVTEMALMQVPPELKNVGITVMDGPFFSLMPFPSRGLHTLSHVRYTPHFNWRDASGVDPYQRLDAYRQESRVTRMVRDTSRYLPAIEKAQYVDSLFEVKTVLIKNEGDDGRPILFEKHEALPGLYSVLGGKVDNIYDVLEKLDAETFVKSSPVLSLGVSHG